MEGGRSDRMLPTNQIYAKGMVPRKVLYLNSSCWPLSFLCFRILPLVPCHVIRFPRADLPFLIFCLFSFHQFYIPFFLTIGTVCCDVRAVAAFVGRLGCSVRRGVCWRTMWKIISKT
uniref:Uncharacterized protein n=1 Tax=Trypanosoma congolense (strain IL3000) TaxID=1068625 RepID=G0UKW7_TRYCI|nr:hypothetical protein, unlikely [Trypanosoma congolense IL3000]